MTTLLAITAPILLVSLLVMSWLLNLLGLPGNWIMLAIVAGYAWLLPAEWRSDLGSKWLIALLALAVVGELLEFLAGAVGTQRAGGTGRAAAYALVGSILGGLTGAFLAIPVPIVGPIIGALVFGGVGAGAGAIVGELSVGSDAARSWRVGQGAFWGRLAGTGAKTLIGCVMIAAVIAAVLT